MRRRLFRVPANARVRCASCADLLVSRRVLLAGVVEGHLDRMTASIKKKHLPAGQDDEDDLAE
eukprot:2410204-Rhodomonas_salina.1